MIQIGLPLAQKASSILSADITFSLSFCLCGTECSETCIKLFFASLYRFDLLSGIKSFHPKKNLF